MIRRWLSHSITITLVALFTHNTLGAQTKEYDYGRISRSMETFGAAFREITTEYIDETDPEVIIAAGIRGMLEELDPYSSYMKSNDEDDVSDLANSNYVGFGFSIMRRNGLLTISDVRLGFPASESGIRPGDRLISIDGKRTDSMHVDSLRPLTRGEVGSQSALVLVRDGKVDTIRVTLTRKSIPVECVNLSTRLSGDIGYIELARFARSAGRDVKSALTELTATSPLKGLILDLRGNPGGLLDAAVSVCEIFLPHGTLIVSTLDRYEHRKEYFATAENPFDKLPLVILVDERSASASEVVAAAIQDNDRGIVIGEPSFGKGLVQTMVTLPFDASMKLTTARYYAPSGRCIQRNVRTDPNQTAEQLFVTRTGRLVKATSGVEPDSIVSDSMVPQIVAHLIKHNVIDQFATNWSGRLEMLPKDFAGSPRLFEEFVTYAAKRKPSDRSELLAALQTGKQSAEVSNASDGTKKAIESAIKSAEKDFEKNARANATLITVFLEAEIQSRFSNDDARAIRVLPLDPMVKTSINLFTSGKITTFFGDRSEEDQ